MRCVREGRGATEFPVSHHCQHWRWDFPCCFSAVLFGAHGQAGREMNPPHQDPAATVTHRRFHRNLFHWQLPANPAGAPLSMEFRLEKTLQVREPMAVL